MRQREPLFSGEPRAVLVLGRDGPTPAIEPFLFDAHAAPWRLDFPCLTLGDEALERWRIIDVTVIHRVGDLRPTDQLNTLCVHPFGSETLYLASQRGPYKSTDAGATWLLLDTVLCYNVTVDLHDPVTLYASGSLTMRRSTDAGATWHDFSSGLSLNSEPMMVAPDPESAGLLYAALCGGEMMDPQSGIYVHRRSVGIWQRKSTSERVASSAENSTSSQSDFASVTPFTAIASTSSRDLRSLYSM